LINGGDRDDGMSDYDELELLVGSLNINCTLPNEDSLITEWLVIYNYWPIALGFIVFGVTITKCNYVFFLLTCTNYIDMGLNYVLRRMIGDSDNIQPANCELGLKQMPALGSQRVAVLYTVIWFIATFTYPGKMGKSNVLLINFCAMLALFSRMYLRFSSPLQMFIGCIIGTFEGFVLSVFFFYLKVHHYDRQIISYLKTWYIVLADDFITTDKYMDEKSREEGRGDEQIEKERREDDGKCTYHKEMF